MCAIWLGTMRGTGYSGRGERVKIVNNVEDYLREKKEEISIKFYNQVTSDINQYEANNQSIISPVEQLFYIEWYSRWFRADEREMLSYFLLPQYQDKTTEKYKIDFKADILGYLLNTTPDLRLYQKREFPAQPPPSIGVEIDGHAWHEKTKEQVQYHKERERFLVAQGWKLFRFTGSEVYRDAPKCVDELSETVSLIVEEWRRKGE